MNRESIIRILEIGNKECDRITSGNASHKAKNIQTAFINLLIQFKEEKLYTQQDVMTLCKFFSRAEQHFSEDQIKILINYVLEN